VNDDEERELRIELMKTQIEHLRGQITWEPWKIVIAAFGAGAAVMGATIGVLGLLLHWMGKL
jgi:hypothetical protein